MKVVLDGTRFEADTVIVCGGRLLEEQADKVGSVRIFGAGGRGVLALVDLGRLLFREYPEACERFSEATCVVENGRGGIRGAGKEAKRRWVLCNIFQRIFLSCNR